MNNTARMIKIGAVVTAAPRWIVALLIAEGLTLPADWLPWWTVMSAILGAGMAVTEALAFAFIFEAWRNQKDRKSDTLLIMAGLAAVIFIAVVAPYIVSNIRAEPLEQVLGTFGTWMWGVAVAASTIIIVAAVGFAQKSPPAGKVASSERHEIMPLAEIKPEGNGTLSATYRQDAAADWRNLPAEDRQLVAGMASKDIAATYGVSERTARGWRLKAQQVSAVEVGKNGNGHK